MRGSLPQRQCDRRKNSDLVSSLYCLVGFSGIMKCFIIPLMEGDGVPENTTLQHVCIFSHYFLVQQNHLRTDAPLISVQ